MSALESYCGWLEMPDAAHAPKYAAARKVIRGALREGCFGLTAVLDTSYPAFYHAAAHSLQWICNRQSLVDILHWDTSLPPRDLHNSFVDDFLEVVHGQAVAVGGTTSVHATQGWVCTCFWCSCADF